MVKRINATSLSALLMALQLLVACKPATEKAYEQNFALRAARDIDSAGNTEFALYYITRAQQEPVAAAEAANFRRRIDERKLRTNDCLEAKKTDLAINQYPRIRHKHLFQMGVCFEEAGDPVRALKFYEMAENASSQQPQLYVRRALLRYRTGNSSGAAADLERAVALNREYPPALLNLVLFRIAVQETEKARMHLEALEALKPGYAEIARDALQHTREIGEYMKRHHGR
jgi:tetratricopeptide (TPR) repeat protein